MGMKKPGYWGSVTKRSGVDAEGGSEGRGMSETNNPHLPAKVNKSSEKATFSFIFNDLRWFDCCGGKMSMLQSIIEPKVR